MEHHDMNQGPPVARDCVFCFGIASMLERLDKRGRPYLTCSACRTRAFLHDQSALRGPILMASILGVVGTRKLAYILATEGEPGVERVMGAVAKGVATQAAALQPLPPAPTAPLPQPAPLGMSLRTPRPTPAPKPAKTLEPAPTAARVA